MHRSLLVQVIVDVDLLGFVYHWGLEVNSVTVIGEHDLSSWVIFRLRDDAHARKPPSSIKSLRPVAPPYRSRSTIPLISPLTLGFRSITTIRADHECRTGGGLHSPHRALLPSPGTRTC